MKTTRECSLPGLIVLSLFFSGMALSTILAAKIITIAGYTVPAGVLAYSLTFVCTDIISEVYGERAARSIVWAGFISMIVVAILIQLAVSWEPALFWRNQKAFELILSSSNRVVIASITAYLLSQILDVWIFDQIRNVTKNKHLWLRNNLSTISAQLLDSIVFVFIAYYGKFPLYELIIGQWMAKIIIALTDTPFVYIGVRLLKAHMTDSKRVSLTI